VASRIEELAKEHGANRIILGGNQESAHAVRGNLPERVAQNVIAILPIPIKETPREILQRVLPPAIAYEREYEAALIDEVIGLAKSGGRGALGRDAVQEALTQQRVELLIVPYPVDNADWVLELPWKALASGAGTEHVHGESAEKLALQGGIAAKLYFTV
jgi:stalled ribosome rescue protein Dom34